MTQRILRAALTAAGVAAGTLVFAGCASTSQGDRGATASATQGSASARTASSGGSGPATMSDRERAAAVGGPFATLAHEMETHDVPWPYGFGPSVTHPDPRQRQIALDRLQRDPRAERLAQHALANNPPQMVVEVTPSGQPIARSAASGSFDTPSPATGSSPAMAGQSSGAGYGASPSGATVSPGASSGLPPAQTAQTPMDPQTGPSFSQDPGSRLPETASLTPETATMPSDATQLSQANPSWQGASPGASIGSGPSLQSSPSPSTVVPPSAQVDRPMR